MYIYEFSYIKNYFDNVITLLKYEKCLIDRKALKKKGRMAL